MYVTLLPHWLVCLRIIFTSALFMAPLPMFYYIFQMLDIFRKNVSTLSGRTSQVSKANHPPEFLYEYST